eukprot:205960_1
MHATVATQLYITSIMAIMIWTSFGGLLWGVAHKNGGDYPLFTIDLTTKDYKQVALLMDKPTEVIYDCINDKMYVAQGGDNFVVDEIDMSNADIIKSLDVDGSYPGLEYVDGILYGSTAKSPIGDGLRILDPITSVAQVLTAIHDNDESISGLAYNIETNTMYGVTAGGVTSVLVTIDLTTGEILPTVTGTGIESLVSLTFDNNGLLYGGDKSGNIYLINTDNGDTELFVDLSTPEDLGNINGLTWVSESGCITKKPTHNPTLAPSQPTLNPSISTKSPSISTESPSISTKAPSISTKSPSISTKSPSISTKSPSISPSNDSGEGEGPSESSND